MSSQALPQGHPSRPSWLMVIALIISPLVIAVFVSFFMHGMLFTILYLTPSVDTQMVDQAEKALRSKEEEKPVDLTVTDVGENPEIAPMMEVKNDAPPPPEVPEVPAQAQNVTENLPMNLTPPPGLGAANIAPPAIDLSATGSLASLAGMGGIYSPGGVGGRTGAAKDQLIKEQGGNPESEVAVAKGLRWLALHQAQDGRWSMKEFHKHGRTEPFPRGAMVPGECGCKNSGNSVDDIAATGLALLPFLGAGVTQKPPKEKTSVDYHPTVLGGLNYLIKKQNKEGAYSDGAYSHAIATIAMCEAYGLTNDPLLKVSSQRALDNIFTRQDPAGGGWRYGAKEAGDMSVTGWMLMAVKSGQMAGLRVNSQRMKVLERFIEACQNPKVKGEFQYLPAEPGNVSTMTSVGMLCKLYLGVRPVNEIMLAAAEILKKQPPGVNKDIYYLYYATQAMHHMGPAAGAWKFWNEGSDGSGRGGIRNFFVSEQFGGPRKPTINNPHQHGSFFIGSTPGNISDNEGGRLMHTSLSLLSLEVYYRHLPLYRREMAAGN